MDPTSPDADLARDLTVAVLHYQTPGVLVECLARVVEAAPGARVLVVDSGDAEPLPHDWPGDSPGFAGAPHVELVRIPNRSYAHAVNVALGLTRTPFLAFLNADVYVRPETLANLVYALRDPETAAVGPVVRDGAGRLQNQGVPYRRFQRRALRGTFAGEVPWLSGCLQVVRMDAVRGPLGPERTGPPAVGGMDPTFRFYNEDMEWGWRMREAGWTCRLVATPAVHLGGTATPDRDAFIVEGLRGGYVLSQRYRSATYRRVHRYAVMLWAAIMERLGRPEKTRAHAAVRTMFARRRFTESPFGATLADENGNFWDEMT